MQQQIDQCLQRFSQPDFPGCLATDIISQRFDQQGQHIQLHLTLPYAAQSLATVLAQYLQQQLPDYQFTVMVHCQLAGSPSYKQIQHIVLVASGKGGVGKSTTAVNLAVGLALEGAKVGLLDADIYGPSIPLMMGMVGQKPISHDGKVMEPLTGHGIKVNSIGFLIAPEDAAVWRGPMASSALAQLVGETHWGELDYLIVDMPPGTGDIQLTIAQKFPCTGAVIVTTPQNIALADAEKGVSMFAKVNIPVLGMVENMSYFQCSHCGELDYIFGRDGALAMAAKHDTALLAQIPLLSSTREQSDNGTPPVTVESPVAPLYRAMARRMSYQLHVQHHTGAKASGPEISFIDD